MTRKLRLLDTFCKAGGAGMGYHLAGFEVVGVDIEPQKRYPFEFHQGDALEFIEKYGKEFDVIHASPPCQAYSVTKSMHRNIHPELIEPTRELLIATGKFYVIENVIGAPLINPIMLCGTMFDLKIYRHRLFECNPWLLMPGHIPHRDRTPRAGYGPSPKGFYSISGKGGRKNINAGWKQAMGIDWMTILELAQAIPPAYTKWIGEQLMRILE